MIANPALCSNFVPLGSAVSDSLYSVLYSPAAGPRAAVQGRFRDASGNMWGRGVKFSKFSWGFFSKVPGFGFLGFVASFPIPVAGPLLLVTL